MYGHMISVTREVNVSYSASRTPQVVMLSTIGNSQELARHGILLAVENPEVGQNFHDYLVLSRSCVIQSRDSP